VTDHFRILHKGDARTAEVLAHAAEEAARRASRKWFGKKELGDWSERCDVYVHPSGDAFSRATGAPATAPGFSTIELDGRRVVRLRIDLRGDDPNLLAGVLPHEVTHVILVCQFRRLVPRWADEGMAVLSEPADRVDLHLRNLPRHRDDGKLFGVAELMRLEDYPEARRVGPFYAQSVSLVAYLCKKRSPATFARFLADALAGDWAEALRRHFGYASFRELQRDWELSTFRAVAQR
jgi:hypothetical protein